MGKNGEREKKVRGEEKTEEHVIQYTSIGNI